MTSRGLFFRFLMLMRGGAARGLRRMEAHHPEAVYDGAIDRRAEQLEKLREAAGHLAYLRSRAESALHATRKDLELVEDALRRAVAENDDARAPALIAKRRTIEEHLGSASERRRTLAEHADRAKASLTDLAGSISALREERSEMLSRRSHARVRADFTSVLESSPAANGAEDALENVRASIRALEHVAAVEVEPAAAEPGVSLYELRSAAERAADAEALAALKRGRDARGP